MLEYENDNIASTDSRFLTRLSRLQVILAYPHTRNATVLDWINRLVSRVERQLRRACCCSRVCVCAAAASSAAAAPAWQPACRRRRSNPARDMHAWQPCM